MKKNILIIFMTIGSLNAFSQSQQDSINNQINLRMDQAGLSFQKSSRDLIAGSIMQIVGGVIVASTSGKDNGGPAVGITLMGIGTIFTFSGMFKIGSGGRNIRSGRRISDYNH
jgi:hypothetical protein